MNATQVLSTLDRYRRDVSAVIAQLEEIQVALNAQYDEFRAQHDSKLDRLAAQVADDLDRTCDAIRTAVDRRQPIEMAGIEERRAKVRDEYLPRREQAARSVLELAQAELAELGALNPQLDEREEALKREKMELEARLEALNDEISAKSRGFGGVWRFVSLSRADRERHRVLGKLEAVHDALYQVRRIWDEQRKTVVTRQASYQEEWRAEAVAIARLQAELDQLDSERRRKALAYGRAVRSVLDELAEPVQCEDEALTDSLAEMARLNASTDRYQSGLAGAAGLIGLLRGIDGGLEAIRKSIVGLQQEQEMHAEHLRPLDFAVPPGVEGFHAQWPALAEQFADEQHLSAHPSDFSAGLEPLVRGPLSEQRIEAMFGELGAMIQRATAAWQG